jgi:hypothetical protein
MNKRMFEIYFNEVINKNPVLRRMCDECKNQKKEKKL